MTTPDNKMMFAEPADADLAEADESLLAALLEELTDLWRRGQHPDVEKVASRHPRLTADLRSLWATVWVAEEMAKSGFGEQEPGEDRFDVPSTTAWPPATESAAPARAQAAEHGLDGTLHGRFGEYELFEELGRGGMGVVSRAREIARGRIVALKRLLRGPASTPQDLERFRIEALAAARLAHPHIVPVFQVGECDGQPYFTMQ